MELIEYIVFFGMAGFALLLYFIYPLDPQPVTDYVPDVYKCESPIEKRVYNGLMLHGYYATPQYQIGPYRIDLAFPGSMLAIECDGKDYHSSPEQKAHDRKKDRYLKERGWTVLRFTGSKIHRDLPEVVSKIKDHVN